MAATAGSIYQLARQAHISASNDTDPQRALENFTSYANRMASHGLQPDILATEADADYVLRVLSYGVASPPTKASELSWVSITNGFNFVSYGCNVTRSAAGNYPVKFSFPVSNPNYLVQLNAYTSSNGLATGSLGFSSNQTVYGFTASFSTAATPLILADVVSGSVLVHG